MLSCYKELFVQNIFSWNIIVPIEVYLWRWIAVVQRSWLDGWFVGLGKGSTYHVKVCCQRSFNVNIMRLDQIIQLACTAAVRKRENNYRRQVNTRVNEVTCRERYTLTAVRVCKTWNIRSPSCLRRVDVQGSSIELPSRDHFMLIDWAKT
jgi:hypothetical protein